MSDSSPRVFMSSLRTPAPVTPSSPNRHVLPHEDGWKITQPGNATPLALHGKKSDAVAAARVMCIESKGELFIHKKDGKIQNRNSYGNDPRSSKG